jgi:hypothetical protein
MERRTDTHDAATDDRYRGVLGSGSGGLGSSTELCPRSNTVVLVYAYASMGNLFQGD